MKKARMAGYALFSYRAGGANLPLGSNRGCVMIEQKQGLPALEKLFKKYHFEPVATVMMTRPEWKPCVGLTVRGTTFIYIIYNSGTAEHYLERLAYRGLAEQIMCEFRKQGVKIHT